MFRVICAEMGIRGYCHCAD